MNLFVAATYTNGYRAGGEEKGRYAKLNDREKECVNSVEHLLESYHYVEGQRYIDAMRLDKVQVFLDSGAFSAFTLGVEIDINKYCDYIKTNDDILRKEDGVVMASVLDGIGDPLKTYQNQLQMEELGAKPLPCFHYGEDERYLEFYVKNYSYITLGGMVGKSSVQLVQWLDRIWDKYLTDGAGNPLLKVHAFGITAIKIMERYPWYSVDSSSWIQSAAFGSIVTAKHGTISVSSQSPARHVQGQHATTLTPIEQDYVFKMLEDAGFTYERLSTVYESRAAFNLYSYGLISATINASKSKTFKLKVQELFG
jgi:hypothetical protein